MNLSSAISIYAVIFYSLQFIFGIPGNVLIIVVYSKKKRKVSTDILIIAQGFIDLAASLLAPINILKSVSDHFTTKIICRIALFGNNSLAFASLFLTAVIAFDRFFFVCRPLGKRTSNRRALCLAVTCWVLGSSLTCTKLIYVDAVTSYVGELTCLVVDTHDFLDTLEAWLKTSGFVFALVTSSVMYGKIYQAIRNQAKVHAQLVGGVSRQMHTSSLSREEQPKQSSEEITQPVTGRDSPRLQSVYGLGESVDRPTDMTFTPRSLNKTTLRVVNNALKGEESATPSYSSPLDHRSLLPSTLTQEPPSLTQHQSTMSQCNPTLTQDQSSSTEDHSTLTQDQPTLTQDPPKVITFGPSYPRRKTTDRGENRTTKMLMAVTVILLASWLPPIVFFHLRDSTLEIIEHSVAAETWVFVGKRLPGINHIINYFVYTFMNKRFRMDCKRLFRK